MSNGTPTAIPFIPLVVRQFLAEWCERMCPLPRPSQAWLGWCVETCGWWMSFFDGCNDVGDFDLFFSKKIRGWRKERCGPSTRCLLMLGCWDVVFFPSFRPLQFRQKDRRQRTQRCFGAVPKKNATDVWVGSFCFLKLPECQSVSLVGLVFFSQKTSFGVCCLF